MSLRLSIVTPDKAAVEVTCDEVAAPGVNGEIGLLPEHVSVITALNPGVLTVIEGNKKRYFAVGTGYAELEGKALTVLTNTCTEADKVDVEAAQTDYNEAEKELGTMADSDDAYPATRRRMLRARARLDAAELAQT